MIISHRALRSRAAARRKSMRLKDKVAVVTGAASGIGKEIARTFAAEGAKIVIADLNQRGADTAAEELDPSRKRAAGVAMDVSSEAQVEAGMAKGIAAFGRLDILVSHARSAPADVQAGHRRQHHLHG